jgi:hypothetical protein
MPLSENRVLSRLGFPIRLLLVVHLQITIGAVMANDPNTRPQEGAAMLVSDTPHAPFIFYEGAPAFGFTNGVINITLSANRTLVGPNGETMNDQVVVAYLRGNVLAALNLKQAIDGALLLAAPTGQGEAN